MRRNLNEQNKPHAAFSIAQVGENYNNLLFNLKKITSDEFNQKLGALRQQAKFLDMPSLDFALKRLEYFYAYGITSINVGGTMGCGKSSIALQLKDKLGYSFKDADAMHPPENIEKQRQGQALEDTDRVTFLDNIQKWLSQSHTITTCSALTDQHRAIISGQDSKILIMKQESKPASPWMISDQNANYGLLQLTICKPYEVAHAELANSTRTLPDGSPHFIQITATSEQEAAEKGATPLLLGQYTAIFNSPPMPWDSIEINFEEIFKDGKYDITQVMNRLLELPYATPNLLRADLY